MLQANFTITPTVGDVIATNYTVTNLTSGATISQYTWDPGTGSLVYNVTNPVFTYNSPGVYTITLTAIDFDGNQSTAQQTITAELAYRDYVRFSHTPDRFADPGKLTPTPFKIDVISSNPDKSIIVDLFATNSKSTPQQFVPQRWNFLNPTWKFLDVNENFITSLSVVPVPVYKNNKIVAVSGTAEFYYVDSASKGDPTLDCPILITATLQTSGFVNFNDSQIYPYESYANNKTARAGVVWFVNDLFPNVIKITGNYIDEIYSNQWEGIKIPVLVTCHSNRSLILSGSEDSLSEVIFTYPKNNIAGKQHAVTLTLSGLSNNQYSIDEAPLYFQATDSNNSRTGGYILTTITPLTTTPTTNVVAQVTATNPASFTNNAFPYPYGYAPNFPVWVSNPEKNTLNKITLIPDPGNCKTINYYRENNILTDGVIKEVQVPALSTDTTFNYTMSGFSGIYGIAIDPRNYDVIVADAELDRLYRFSNTGDILKTFELTSLGDFDPQQKLFEFWSWTTPSPLVSSTRFTFYKPTPIGIEFAPDPKNYIAVLGGLVQSVDTLQIDTFYKTARFIISPTLTALNTPQYPPENITFDLIQIYNPTLPTDYISSIRYWTFVQQIPTNSVFLPSAPSLSGDTGHYIISIEGVVQRPDSFTVNDVTKTITFSQTVPQNTIINIVYLPKLLTPATWTRTFTSLTNTFSLTGSINYKLDDKSTFLVNIGGVLQSPKSYKHILSAQQLLFTDSLPTNVPISVTQYSVSDKVNTPAAYTPAYVSLDKDFNIWVSLFNSVSVLKFDQDFNLLFSTVPNNIGWLKRAGTNAPKGIDYQSSFYADTTRYIDPTGFEIDIGDEFFLKPPVVETDKNNNCWTTYAHPICSILVKYSPTGQVLSEIPLPNYTTPINLAITPNNNVWVSNFHGSSYVNTSLSGNIQLYDTNTSAVLKTVTGISRPGNISLDRGGNLWFTHGLRNIGHFNTTTNTLCSWTLELTGGFTVFVQPSSSTDFYREYENEMDEELGGMAVDVFNRVWVLDSLQNYAWVISATPNFDQAPIRYFKIRPDVTLGYYIDLITGSTYTETDDTYYYRSAQATGDWTGNRWYQKYATPQFLSAVQLTGVSTPFAISEFVNKNQIRRVNESFNASEYLKSLALPENLNSNPVLWDKFFAAAVGTGVLSANEDVGQITYERIANFISNHSDIDICNIDQLLSLAEQTDTPAFDYSAIYPTDIRNMLDITSIPRSKLWGLLDNSPLTPQSIGDRYNTQTDNVTAGTKIVLKNKFDSSISVVPVPPLNGQLIYPLSQFEGYGFVQPVTVNYLFFKFEPVYTGNYIENVIDWGSDFTTLQPTASTVEAWYGDQGAIETAFRYILTKNLFLK